MGFRFRRSIRILPGLRLNFGKRGVSTSIGVRGAHVTVGHGQVRETVGLPGTGLSYTHVEGTHKTAADASGEAQPQPVPDVLPKGRAWRGWVWIAFAILIIVCLVWNSAAKAEVPNCWQSGSEFARCAATWERVFQNGNRLGNLHTAWDVGSFESFVMGVSGMALQNTWCPTAPYGTDTIFAKYLREHPEEWGKTPDALVLAPLALAFPCSIKKP
jgi:Protein of unknown function (DUF4236)/Rap1a immunity proteins